MTLLAQLSRLTDKLRLLLLLVHYTLNEKPTALGSDANTDNTLVFGVDNTEILRGSDNITSVAVNNEGTQYLEVPSVTIALVCEDYRYVCCNNCF